MPSGLATFQANEGDGKRRHYHPNRTTGSSSSERDDPSSAWVVYVRGTTANLPEAEPEPQLSDSDKALERLRAFLDWPDNWDGEGAPAPRRDHINSAINLLALLRNTHRSFAVHLTADAQPIFFPRWLECTGEIVIEDNESLSFRFDQRGHTSEGYMIDFDGRRLPQELKDALLNS